MLPRLRLIVPSLHPEGAGIGVAVQAVALEASAVDRKHLDRVSALTHRHVGATPTVANLSGKHLPAINRHPYLVAVLALVIPHAYFHLSAARRHRDVKVLQGL